MVLGLNKASKTARLTLCGSLITNVICQFEGSLHHSVQDHPMHMENIGSFLRTNSQ